MTQTSQPKCLQCGTPLVPGQRFCSNCGAIREEGLNNPTAQSAAGSSYAPGPQGSPELPRIPPPPPLAEQYAQTPPGYTYYPPQSPQNFAQAQQSYQAVPPPTYAKPQKDATRSVLTQMGCGVLLVILLVVGACGGLSYFVYRQVTANSYSPSASTSTTSTNNTANSGSPQAVPTAVAQINQMITYASVEINILNVQEASSFSDDANSNSPVLVRVNVKEYNPTAGEVFLFYGDNFRLILPDGTAVAPVSEHDNGGINQTVTRTNWVDFPLSSSTEIGKLIMRLGGASEAQMDVPLTGKADLGKYQLKTINPNAPFQYAGLSWTLTTVTSSWSANGKQADSGMRYVVVTLKADNPTANPYYAFANDYIRLQGGGVTNAPASNTFNTSIAAGATGKVGTVTFLMPQSASSFTLIMLARTDTTPAASQIMKEFEV